MGLLYEFFTPNTPQLNGIFERKNRVIQKIAIDMLNSKNLAKYFWVKAINTSCYTLN